MTIRKTVNIENLMAERIDRNDIRFRIERSVVQSLLDLPSVGLEQLRFAFVENDELEGSFATDGNTIFYNPFAVNKMNEQQLNTALVHQTLHYILKHLQRRENRSIGRWDAACDEEVKVVINDEIKQSKRHYYTNYHFDKNMIATYYRPGTTAEQIYDEDVAERSDDIHSLWELAKMESTRLRDTSAIDFDFSKVFNGEAIDIPENSYDQFAMMEALSVHVLENYSDVSNLTQHEVTNFLKFSYNFPTAICVYLLKRTVQGNAFRCKLLITPEWIQWAKKYKTYIM